MGRDVPKRGGLDQLAVQQLIGMYYGWIRRLIIVYKKTPLPLTDYCLENFANCGDAAKLKKHYAIFNAPNTGLWVEEEEKKLPEIKEKIEEMIEKCLV